MIRGVLVGLLILGAVTTFVPACADAAGKAGEGTVNTLTDAEKKAGWKLLFDGKTTAGFRGYQKTTVPAAWSVQDGALSFAGSKEGAPVGDLVTVDQYDSFELQIDWRISEGGNSGVMYHVLESEEQPYMTGPEMQVLDNQRHADGASALTAAGSCYGLYPAAKDVTRPVGQWNQARLLVDGAHVEHWLNGEKLTSYDLGSAAWNAKVASSKFKDWKAFGKAPRGFIDLQDHHAAVAYRNIKIRVIKPGK
jgi:hypothetical protein